MKKSIGLFTASLLAFGAVGALASIPVASKGAVEVKALPTVYHVKNFDEFFDALCMATTDYRTTIYVENTIVIDETFTEDVVIHGYGATVRVERPYLNEDGSRNAEEATLLDGKAIINIKQGAPNVYISDLNIMGGSCENDSRFGTIMCNQAKSLTLENISITRSNFGINVKKTPTIIKGCNILRNYGTNGVGIELNSCDAVIDNCSICENINWESDEYTSVGAGIKAETNTGASSSANKVLINNCVIANNASRGVGSGVYSWNQDLTIMNSTITGNVDCGEITFPTASTMNFKGGAGVHLYRYDRPGSGDPGLYMANCVVTNNIKYDDSNNTYSVHDVSIGSQNHWNTTKSKLKVYNSILTSDYNYNAGVREDEIVSQDVKRVEESDNTVSAAYRDDGVVLYASGEKQAVRTPGFNHPMALHKDDNIYSPLHVSTLSGGSAATGGIDTYLSYALSDGSLNVKASLGNPDTAFSVYGKATLDDLVNKYYDNSATRASGVMGACKPVSAITNRNIAITPVLQDEPNFVYGGITQFGDSCVFGEYIKISGTPKEGYGFRQFDIKWIQPGATISKSSTDNPYNLAINGYTIVTAQYDSFKTISYNANGGQGTVPESVQGIGGTVITLPSGDTLSKTGYAFIGWNTEADGKGTDYEAGSEFTIGDSNQTLYAKWEANTYVITLKTYNGEGDGYINVKYDSYIPDLKIPEREGYTFNGYYTEVEGGGTKYVDAQGKGVVKWTTLDNGTLHAQWLLSMSVSATGYEGVYDGEEHTISVSVTNPVNDYQIRYRKGTSGAYNLEEAPKYVDAVTDAVVGFQITKEGYATYTGEATVTISKAEAHFVVDPKPVEALKYTGEPQELVIAGSSTEGSYVYKLEGEEIFSSELPKATETGEYKVYYQFIGDKNHLDDEVKYLTVTISENNKQALIDIIDDANDFYDKNSDYEAASSLHEAIDAAEVVKENPNVTESEIGLAVEALEDALCGVQIDVTEEKIDAIGIVVYTTDCKDLIDTAREAYDSLTGGQATEVTNYETLTAAEAAYAKLESDHQAAEQVESLIDMIGEVEYTKECKDKIDAAREAFEGLNEKQQECVDAAHLERLERAEIRYALLEAAANAKGLPSWSIALIEVGGLLLLCALAYVLCLFAFNKWISENGKAVRAFKLWKKDDKHLVFAFPFKFVYRSEKEIYNSKKEASK